MTDSLYETTRGAGPGMVEVLDCTLRDGSYSVGFQFPEATIRDVLTGLQESGVRLIELGHGLGINAGEALSKPSLVSDEKCYEIASDTLQEAAWGMFCIPGIATLAQLEQAAAAGMRFVRIGVDVTDVAPAAEFVERAKELGLTTFTNLMKTNVLEAPGVIEAVARCADYGADTVYLVDSVGGYLPDETAELFRTVAAAVDVSLGFHGHDNLGLANANALAAAGEGARYIDATLDGIGRGAGNTITEVFATILCRQGSGGYDYRGLAELSEAAIRPLRRIHDDRTYQVVGGLTRTHSSFFPLITRCAQEQGVDVFELMAAVADIERVNPTEELVMGIAGTLSAS